MPKYTYTDHKTEKVLDVVWAPNILMADHAVEMTHKLQLAKSPFVGVKIDFSEGPKLNEEAR